MVRVLIMKIVVLGSSGLVGHAVVCAALKRNHEVIAFYNQRRPQFPGSVQLKKMDLVDVEEALPFILQEFPDAIINAAAISNPADVDASPDLAEKINIALPRRLAQIANHLNGRILHLSTDMLFDGEEAPYITSDKPNPCNLYGQTKLLAEREVLQYGGELATVLRMTIAMGNSPSGSRSVHEKLFSLWAQGKKAALFSNEIRQPCSAENIAAVCIELCERTNLHGIFHWAGSESLSRLEMGQRILKHFKLPEELIEAVEIEGTDRRPRDLRFSLEPLIGKLKTQSSLFQEQLEELTVPPAYQKWYEEMLNLPPSDSKIPTTRLVKGRDF